MIIGLLILIATLAYDLYTDTRPNVKVNHFRGWLLRFPSFAVASWFIGWQGITLVFAYWTLFDTGWALIKGLTWTYVGTTAELDKLQRKYPVIQVLKYVAGIISIILLCVTK